MNCANHVDAPAVAYCRTCGKPLCSVCGRDIRGVIYCEECLASHLSGVIPPAAPTAVPLVPSGEEPQSRTPSPTLAAILGFIPGVGAMYNGEFAKGFIHVLVFATLIWMTAHINGLFGLGIAAFVIYMPIEAYKTARARQLGLPAPDPLGLNHLFVSGSQARPAGGAANVAPADAGGGAAPPSAPGAAPPSVPVNDEPPSRVPVAAFVLIGLGVLFLMGEMDLFRFDWLAKFWPLILIAIGVRILMQRQRRGW